MLIQLYAQNRFTLESEFVDQIELEDESEYEEVFRKWFRKTIEEQKIVLNEKQLFVVSEGFPSFVVGE